MLVHARQRWAETAERRAPILALQLVILAVLLRIAAFVILELPIGQDGASYLSMADTLLRSGVPTDIHGQHGFYSIGYPLILTPFVLALGATATAALITNLVLTVATMWLLWRVAHAIGLPRWSKLTVIAIYATWLPGIWNAAMPARENLSTPLLLAVLLASLAMLRGTRGATLMAGLLCGLAMLAGGSALLLSLAPLTALWINARGHAEQLVRGGAMLAAGLLIPLLPWLAAMQAMTGSATLATNSGFNFYLGHNPVATGRFVSIADTPAGPRWESMRESLGEAGASTALAAEGRAFIAANPERSIALAARKLVGFWAPNVPDADDFASRPDVSFIRIGEVAQYGLILLLALWALWHGRVTREHRRVILAIIVGFWVVHAAAYVMPRYRDPVMPVLMLLAVAAISRRGVKHGR
jgi:hypothetical protein